MVQMNIQVVAYLARVVVLRIQYILRDPGTVGCWVVSDFGGPVEDEVLREASGIRKLWPST